MVGRSSSEATLSRSPVSSERLAPPRATVIVVRDGDTSPAGLVSALAGTIDGGSDPAPFDVRITESPRPGATDDDGVTAVVRAIRASGAPRWLLAASGSDVRVVVEAAARILSGEAGVFGLAGLVVTEAVPPHQAPGVPILVLDDTTAPSAAVDAVAAFWRDRAGLGPIVSRDFAEVIASTRTSPQTRALLARRALADDPDYQPEVLSVTQLDTLRLVGDLVVPQRAPRPEAAIDLAARIDVDQNLGKSDGWRNAALPPDIEAYRRGLDALADLRLLDLDQQLSRVQTIIDGGFEPAEGGMTAEQMQLWFEDARVDLVRAWLAHPATMERVGFDGFANGGPGGALFQGYDLLGADRREQWEPTMEVVR
jgi:hypothetical protein